MDVSGGSGQPRSGKDEPAEHPAGPTAPATGPTDHPGPEPHDAPEAPERTPPAPRDPEDVTGEDEDTAIPQSKPDEDTRPTGPEPATGDAARTVNQEPKAREDAEGASATAETDDAARAATSRSTTDAAARAATSQPTTGDDTRAASSRPTTGDDTRVESEGHRTLAHSGIAKGEPPQPRPEEPGGGLLMGRLFGVPVYVAPSWFLVAALITWVVGGQLDRVLPELGAARYLVSLVFAVAFYASVLVHELAHTVAAIRFKLPVRRIQLQFFGGVSEIEKEAETPGREFVLAFVGPLLSLVLAGLFYLAMKPVEPDTVPGVLLAGLMISNLIVAAFNLLPGLPLDGGRMLRAVVWKITGRPMSGTVAAAWVGRALALSVLVGLPLLNQSGAFGGGNEDISGMDTVTDALLAAILAAIIWTGAGNSLRMARLREHLPELRARTLTRRAVPVQTDTPLSEALRRANAAGARALVVVDADGNPLSLVREAAIVGVPEHRRPWVAVSGLAQELNDGMRVSAELAGEELLDALRAAPATEYLVVEESGEIYGVLSAADVERAFVKAMARPS
ncbi:site-2 protease family protein [Streptomyces sp. NPDC005728]|uniref:site-2 protease family protein n=1 Tax=Streptomyces sp. NPDC005728 TaxID=3157054 RepID=UPI0033C38E30